jgi:hypothetical protein
LDAASILGTEEKKTTRHKPKVDALFVACFHSCFFLRLLFNPDDGGSAFF